MDNVPSVMNLRRKLRMHVFTFNLGAMFEPLAGESRSLAQQQADIRAKLLIIGVNSYWPLSLNPSIAQ